MRKTGAYSFWLLIAVLLVATSAAGGAECYHCGGAIAGRFVQYDGHIYHTDCYEKYVAPRCGVCGEPIIGTWIVYEGGTYHQHCYEAKVALRCSVCGEIIEGEYLYDHWGNAYHSWHSSEIAHCSFCGRLLSDPEAGGGKRLHGDKFVCSKCDRDAVRDADEAAELLEQVRHHLAEVGITIRHQQIGFDLITPQRMAELSNTHDSDHFGLTQYQESLWLGLLSEQKFSVSVLEGMPRMHFILTAAHELMHVWLYLNAPEKGDQALVEGSCNYAGLLVLQKYDDEMVEYVIRQLEEEPDSIYGEGFRRVRRLVDNRGVKFWLEHLQFDPEFPIGY
jgi:hypothetical protein